MNAKEHSPNVQPQTKSLDAPLIPRDASSDATTLIGSSSTILDKKKPLKSQNTPEKKSSPLPAVDIQPKTYESTVDKQPKTYESKQKLLNQSPQVQFDDIQRKESTKGKQPLLPKKSPKSKEELKDQAKRKDKQWCGCCRKTTPNQVSENDATHIEGISGQHGSKCSHSSLCRACCCGLQISESERLRRERCKASCSQCCKKFMAFLFSHIGLSSIVVAYTIMGGFLFSHLEASQELKERVVVSMKRHDSVSKLWNLTQELNVLYERNWTAIADHILKDFQDEVVKAVREGGWDGRDEFNTDVKWSFSGSLLYSITVITTIGYGHIAPRTDLGRLITMLYAMLGIPLTLLCLSNIGSSCANCFRFLYKHMCHFLLYLFCPAKHKKKKLLPKSSSKTTSTSKTKPKSSKSTEKSKKTEADIISAEEGTCSKDKDANSSLVDQSEPESEEVRVPIFVSLIIILGYVFGGAVLFSLWETDWNYLIGAYFCFITLSTIGFGDFVFGVGTDLDSNEKLITCALYLVMGLSIIAMCFNLMQEEVKAKFRSLGRKLGIVGEHKGSRGKK